MSRAWLVGNALAVMIFQATASGADKKLSDIDLSLRRSSQQAGQVAENPTGQIMNEKGGPPGSNQLPVGTETPLPGGGPKLGVGPVGPGGTSQTTQDPNEGPRRYANRPPSWENLTETDSGRNRNGPAEGNTSVASGSNIFGTSPVPFALGPSDY